MPQSPEGVRASAPNGLKNDDQRRLERIWKRAYQARSKDDLLELYADWSDSYDADHRAIGYVGHEIAATVFGAHVGDPENARVLDAGAGTGAAGAVLAELGYRHVTALDLSPAMIEKARGRGVYEALCVADLGQPVDGLATDAFDGALLVGVFSFGQAPAHALDEIVRVVRPGGIIAFTARDDFFDGDAMSVRSKVEELVASGALRPVHTSEPHKYLPKRDPKALFRVRCFAVTARKRIAPTPLFESAVRASLTAPGPVKRLDHSHIWDATASRLYEAYIRRPEYYLTECEEEIVVRHATSLAADHDTFVELGCGSARKVRPILEAAVERAAGRPVDYLPIDVSAGALDATCGDLRETFGDRVRMKPQRGRFDAMLSRIPADVPKSIFFFGSSIGNFETLEATRAFLASIGERMTPRDRLIVGFDMQKDEKVLLRAYNAGPENRSFFVHMVRRMNRLLDADFDLDAFALGSTYEAEPAWRGLCTRRVNLRVVTRTAQDANVARLGLRAHLDAGDAVQVGISRKFRTDDIRLLARHAGLALRTLWFDSLQYFVLAELVTIAPDDEGT